MMTFQVGRGGAEEETDESDNWQPHGIVPSQPQGQPANNTRIGRRVSSDDDRSGCQGMRLEGDPHEMA
ncbi:unnamed protein product [Rangifer tarandus platyrhynchus]|uniref:Uncharacterized protein n=1 Tax=Rangifer tarandus platyrhynchus TaxID=3082113 RepID=A0AC59YBR6_RANTA